jgi:hypothetical protein
MWTRQVSPTGIPYQDLYTPLQGELPPGRPNINPSLPCHQLKWNMSLELMHLGSDVDQKIIGRVGTPTERTNRIVVR